MPGNMYIPPRGSNPFLNMGYNMLSQMAMAKYAQNMRAEEAQKEREQKMKVYEGKMETQLALSGYQQIPEGAPVEPGAVKVGGNLYRQGEIKPVPIKDGDKLLGYAMNVGGKYEFVKNEATNSKYKIGELKPFTIGEKEVQGMYTGDPADAIEGVPGWKRTNIEAPRYKQGETKVDIKMPPLEAEADKALGKGIGEVAASRVKAAQEAVSQNVNLMQLERAIEKGARTGWGEDTLLTARTALETFGIDTGDLSGGELVRKIGSEMALRLRNPESGLGLTGSTSNRDLQFLQDATVGLQRTERGNILIVKSAMKVNQMKVDAVKHQTKLIRENGGKTPIDLDEKMLEFVDNYKLFDEKDKAQLSKASQKVINTGIHKSTGRKTIQLEDGSWEYAN
jgi:hypothetical protein